MDKFLEKLMTISLFPIVAFNFLGSIVGGIWLLFLGEWRLVLFVFLLNMFFPWLYSMTVGLLQLPLSGLIYWLENKKKRIPMLLAGATNMIFGHAVDLFWVAIVFFSAISISAQDGNLALPYILLGWGVATGGFAYMASKEPPDSLGSFIAVYLAQISYIIFTLFYYLGILEFALLIIIALTLTMEIYILKYINSEMKSQILTKKAIYGGICRRCGNAVQEEDNFCTKCGNKL